MRGWGCDPVVVSCVEVALSFELSFGAVMDPMLPAPRPRAAATSGAWSVHVSGVVPGVVLAVVPAVVAGACVTPPDGIRQHLRWRDPLHVGMVTNARHPINKPLQ